MSSKSKLLFAAALFAAGLASGSAFAFSEVQAPTNPDGTARFADPDDFADSLSDALTNSGGGNRSNGYLHMFGSGDAAVGFGASHSQDAYVTSHGTLARPYDPADPSTQR